MVAKSKKQMGKPKSVGPLAWENDDEKYPTKNTNCRVCGRYGPMRLAWDLHGYLCVHAGKCISRAVRVRAGEDVNEPE